MNTQQLKEELQGWQEHYSDPADKNNYDFFTALIAAVDRLEAAERERDEMNGALKASSDNAVTWMKRALKAEIEIARRDAAAGEPVADMWLVRKEDGTWKECGTGYHRGRAVYFNHHVAAEPPAVLPDIEPLIEGALKLHGLRTAVDGHSQLSDGFRNGARWAAKELRAQPPKAVRVQSADFLTLYKPAVLPAAIGEIRLGEYGDDGTRPATVVCLHDQADWENFADGTKLYLGSQPQKPAPDGWKLVPVEPTQRMIDAYNEGMVSGGATRAYRDMLAAAPAPGGDVE